MLHTLSSIQGLLFLFIVSHCLFLPNLPGDFATKVKQINSQSDLIWMSSFAGPSYLTIRSSVYVSLIWDPYIYFFIFTISDKLDAFTYVGNLANVDFISMNK